MKPQPNCLNPDALMDEMFKDGWTEDEVFTYFHLLGFDFFEITKAIKARRK